jgi:hypothetical protein
MSKLPRTQEELIDSSISVEDVHTNTKIVSNQIRYGDNNVIDQAQNMNGHIKLPKSNCAMKFSNGKRAYPALDVANPMEIKRGENIPTRKSSRIASHKSDVDYAKI